MCQAMEAESNLIGWLDACRRERDHELKGRNARQDGTPREAWMSLTYGVRLDAPDDAETMHTPAWWMAHSWNGPLIKSWLSGWDEENARIAAGGLPLTDGERKRMKDDLAFLARLRHEADSHGHRVDMNADTLCRLFALVGIEAAPEHRHGSWQVAKEGALSWIAEAIARIEAVLVPHRAKARRPEPVTAS